MRYIYYRIEYPILLRSCTHRLDIRKKAFAHSGIARSTVCISIPRIVFLALIFQLLVSVEFSLKRAIV